MVALPPGGPLTPAPDPRRVLREHGLYAKHAWGQNFLVDLHVVQRIADAVGAGADDMVVELGGGLGTYSRYLAERAGRLVVVERDRELVPVLRRELAAAPHARVLEANALGLDYDSLVAEAGRPLLLTGNLPYQISKPLLMSLLDAGPSVARVVVMLQREVADRCVEPPGSKAYGILSVSIQARAAARVLFSVKRGSFHPVPRVDSAVLALTPRLHPAVAQVGYRAVHRIAQAAFAQRRKMLRRALAGLAQADGLTGQVDDICRAAGLDSALRAERLGLDELAALAAAWSSARVQ